MALTAFLPTAAVESSSFIDLNNIVSMVLSYMSPDPAAFSFCACDPPLMR